MLGPAVAHADGFPFFRRLLAGLPVPHVLPRALLLVLRGLISFPRAHGRLRVAAPVRRLVDDGDGSLDWGALLGLQLNIHDGLHLGPVKMIEYNPHKRVSCLTLPLDLIKKKRFLVIYLRMNESPHARISSSHPDTLVRFLAVHELCACFCFAP